MEVILLFPYKQLWAYLSGQVYIPETVQMLKGERILHISDTPKSFYPALEKLLKILKPEYIIHTGDLVDNLKLQLFPNATIRYERDLNQLIQILNHATAKKIYIALGNHDNPEIVKRLASNMHIIDEFEQIEINGVTMGISHYPRAIQTSTAPINFFGHNLNLQTQTIGTQVFYNGISKICLMELDNLEPHFLDYPWGTDDARLGKGKLGF